MTDKQSEWLVSLYRSYRASGMSEAEAARLVDGQMCFDIVAKRKAHRRKSTGRAQKPGAASGVLAAPTTHIGHLERDGTSPS